MHLVCVMCANRVLRVRYTHGCNTSFVTTLTIPPCRYLQLTLDQYVEQDYTIVYFHHGLNSSNKPNFSVVLQGYKELARK